MLVNLKKINEMGLEPSLGLMEIGSLEIGKMVEGTESVLFFIQMDQFILESTNSTSVMEKAPFSRIRAYTSEIGPKTGIAVREQKRISTGVYMLESLKVTKGMESVHLQQLMVQFGKVSGPKMNSFSSFDSFQSYNRLKK